MAEKPGLGEENGNKGLFDAILLYAKLPQIWQGSNFNECRGLRLYLKINNLKMEKEQIKEAKGKLGVLVVGVGGAVASTFIAGTLITRKGLGIPVGSIT